MRSKYHIIKPGDWHHDGYVGHYEFDHKGYFRRIRTSNERRQNYYALLDGYHVRGKRRKLRSSWDDVGYSFSYGRCWKRFTRRKHQYHGAGR